MSELVSQLLMVTYAVLVSFVLNSASRNQREMRPHGRAIVLAGHAAFSASATLALLLAGWACLYALGYVPELPLA